MHLFQYDFDTLIGSITYALILKVIPLLIKCYHADITIITTTDTIVSGVICHTTGTSPWHLTQLLSSRSPLTLSLPTLVHQYGIYSGAYRLSPGKYCNCSPHLLQYGYHGNWQPATFNFNEVRRGFRWWAGAKGQVWCLVDARCKKMMQAAATSSNAY